MIFQFPLVLESPAGGAGCDCPALCSMAASSGLRQGCSTACTLCPSKAVQSVQSPPQLGILCLSGASAGRDSTVHHPEYLRQHAPARLAPQVGAAISPLPSAHILSRRAFLAGVTAGQLRRPATTPTRPSHGQLPLTGTHSTARHTGAGKFREKNYQGAAAAPPPLWGSIISGISSWVER